jgi:tetratricopeptide (TPR) repeat protein
VVRRKIDNPEAYLYYARVLKMNGKLDDARAAYEEYLKLEPADTQATTELMACDSAISWINNPTRMRSKTSKILIPDLTITARFFASSDYKELYITSSRGEGKVPNCTVAPVNLSPISIIPAWITNRSGLFPLPLINQ